MQVTSYESPKLTDVCDIANHVIDCVPSAKENDVFVVSSKIVAIAEGSVISASKDREDLIKEHADYWLDPAKSNYGHHFTIKHHTLLGAAGIDTSNVQEGYVLLPKNPQASANLLRKKLSEHYGVSLGVVISDSASVPLRRGSVGVPIAHSGFMALHSYIGKPDLFNNPLQHSVANRAQAIASAATLEMGEGNEQKPIAVVSEITNFKTHNQDPTQAELVDIYPSIEDDLFEPFWKAVGWENKSKEKSSE